MSFHSYLPLSTPEPSRSHIKAAALLGPQVSLPPGLAGHSTLLQVTLTCRLLDTSVTHYYQPPFRPAMCSIPLHISSTSIANPLHLPHDLRHVTVITAKYNIPPNPSLPGVVGHALNRDIIEPHICIDGCSKKKREKKLSLSLKTIYKISS